MFNIQRKKDFTNTEIKISITIKLYSETREAGSRGRVAEDREIGGKSLNPGKKKRKAVKLAFYTKNSFQK